MSGQCGGDECSAHTFIVDAVKELKDMNGNLLQGQHDLKETVIKLTENLHEMRRFNDRLEKAIVNQERKEEEQDKIIAYNKKISDRVAVVGAIGLAVIPVFVSWILSVPE